MKAILLPYQDHTPHTIDWCRRFVLQKRCSLALRVTNARRRAHVSKKRIHDRAFDKGYAAGLAAAQASAAPLLNSLLEITETRSSLYREQVLASAVEFAEQILQQQLNTNVEAYRGWLHQAMSIMKNCSQLSLHHEPTQSGLLSSLISPPYAHITLVPDESIMPGEIVLRGDIGSVRFAWRDALRRILEAGV